MYNKIVFLSIIPLNQHLEDSLYILKFREKIDIEFWFLGNIMPKPIVNKLDYKSNSYRIRNIDTLPYFKELVKSEASLSKVLFISTFTFTYDVKNVFVVLNKYKCHVGIFARGALPTFKTSENPNIFKYIVTKFKGVRLLYFTKKALSEVHLFLLINFRVLKVYDYIFKAGSKGIVAIGFNYKIITEKASKIIDINSFDYDKYIQLSAIKETYEIKPYIVFLDDNMAFHPDVKIWNIATVEPNEYYENLNSFFEKIEDKYGMNIIIAAHPKSEYKDTNLFKGRQIIKNETASLVKNASFCFAHMSTSVSVAILYQKPLVFLTTDYIEQYIPAFKNNILGFSNYLKKSIVNICSYQAEDDLDLSVDLSLYEQYKYDFLTSINSETEDTYSIISKMMLTKV